MDYFEDILELVKKHIVSICSVIFGVVCLTASLIYVNIFLEPCEECEICTDSSDDEKLAAVVEEAPRMLSVDVKGAVKKAGVYELVNGSNIQDAILAAGGLNAKGVTTNINLSKKVTDEMVVYVFTQDELKKRESANEVVCEIPKCECETVTVNDCPPVNAPTTKPVTDDKKTDELPSQTALVSINKATVEELTTLDGIGESKAKTIVEYREKNGPFTAIEDIQKVSGIGAALYEKIKDKLTL